MNGTQTILKIVCCCTQELYSRIRRPERPAMGKWLIKAVEERAVRHMRHDQGIKLTSLTLSLKPAGDDHE